MKTKCKQLTPHIVADPKICHGKPTFQGTRIMVSPVLELLASGKTWGWIVDQYHGKITREAIAEALELAGRIFVENAGAYSPPRNGMS